MSSRILDGFQLEAAGMESVQRAAFGWGEKKMTIYFLPATTPFVQAKVQACVATLPTPELDHLL